MADVLELHKAGVSDREIGRRLTISHTQVAKDRKQALSDITRPMAEEVLKVTSARLEDLYFLAYVKAKSESDVPAINAAVNVLDKVMRLYRLDEAGTEEHLAAFGGLLDKILRPPTPEDTSA